MCNERTTIDNIILFTDRAAAKVEQVRGRDPYGAGGAEARGTGARRAPRTVQTDSRYFRRELNGTTLHLSLLLHSTSDRKQPRRAFPPSIFANQKHY